MRLACPARSLALAAVLAGCAGSSPTAPPTPPAPPRWILVAGGLASPVHLTAAPGDATRLFVVEQAGRIRILRGGALVATPFLDLTDRVLSGGERGLLSVAFHPQFRENRRLFVYYTAAGGAVTLSELSVPAATPDRAEAGSERVLLTIPHPSYANHDGGQLAFGPDGFLYAGTGDGGGAGDPHGQGQDTSTLLGKLLRLDVDGARPYAIPADNPGLPAPEVWAYGLRNPWRFSFDRTRGDLYVGDVGQDAWEEIDYQAAGARGGRNYGWNAVEGDGHCFDAGRCATLTGDTRPIAEYGHVGGDCAVVGGFVYRGAALPGLVGAYLYGDACTGALRSLRVVDGVATARADLTSQLGALPGLSSFGEDADGELYGLSVSGGQVLRLAPGP